MVATPNSSNVHSVGYDYESAYLYVRFLGYVRGTRGPDGHALRGGPGSLYRYSNVTPEEPSPGRVSPGWSVTTASGE